MIFCVLSQQACAFFSSGTGFNAGQSVQTGDAASATGNASAAGSRRVRLFVSRLRIAFEQYMLYDDGVQRKLHFKMIF